MTNIGSPTQSRRRLGYVLWPLLTLVLVLLLLAPLAMIVEHSAGQIAYPVAGVVLILVLAFFNRIGLPAIGKDTLKILVPFQVLAGVIAALSAITPALTNQAKQFGKLAAVLFIFSLIWGILVVVIDPDGELRIGRGCSLLSLTYGLLALLCLAFVILTVI